MRYLDTSVLVSAYTSEPATPRVLSLLNSGRDEATAISEWVATEFHAALSIKIRTQEIDEAYRDEALALFATSIAEAMDVVPVTTAHFRYAARLADQHELGLRAGDALHLAIASDVGATLWTLDNRLARAGEALGVAVKPI